MGKNGNFNQKILYQQLKDELYNKLCDAMIMKYKSPETITVEETTIEEDLPEEKEEEAKSEET